MFENIKKEIAAHEAKSIQEFGLLASRKTAGEILNSWYYKQYLTDKTLAALKRTSSDARPDADTLDRICAKFARKARKETAARLEKLGAAENAAGASWFDVNVEWTKSRTWGNIPHAKVYAPGCNTTGTASGCGYDKESAAIADALNSNPEVMRILYNHIDAGGIFLYGVHVFAGIPSFQGGVGVSCFSHIFEALGYNWRTLASGRTFDAYEVTKKEA
ncbi:MAG: hypothetical protein II008_03830 [Oscillospiraceae bacterium]|nr:hypothetical protein [Oscillospiraceae bacterium]